MRNTDTELGSNGGAIPNPKRVEAGRRNRAKRKGLTPEGRERLRLAAQANRPWLHSTGPRTPEGKAVASTNGKKRQLGLLSLRELKNDLRQLRTMLKDMSETRRSVAS